MSGTNETFIVGLIGEGITASLTPPMHEREAAHQGLRYIYRPIDLLTLGRPGTDVGEVLRWGRDLGFNAFNVTHPCKQLVLAELDDVSDDAARLGAVNTVLIRNSRFIGHNTDFSGFGSALADGLPDAELDSAVQLGAGGAGAAVAYALLSAGTRRLTILDLEPTRAADRAAALTHLFPGRQITSGTPGDLPAALPGADGLVHATPLGMHSHPGLAVDLDLLDSSQWVADVVYRPVDTELVRGARAKGCRVLDGGRMAVGQAVDAFELITGIRPDPVRMHAHLTELISQGR
ncbi:shikimate dehydrogenase [Arthrobacter sp. zg-Y20]|uniref:shikimate dehydrogenase n=1 Tax=unclassified Arthrobacter TaxID=235627 RepID=UPI001D155A2D|nr:MULTISPECIES: shikimate dehydrogenase [unclassified Arthrobacter]MCC3274658.1 shikimate dehydrogenase [Arthrobacter sp. zg-Y20]MDK1314814.1 shikimate dehydrogenase [Arthrobacter sp. zg.Y20]WIB04678.1 shikimate dehydrogenase [Arthrobacter sp. zg-Y20]